jgi:hypothetical protein
MAKQITLRPPPFFEENKSSHGAMLWRAGVISEVI